MNLHDIDARAPLDHLEYYPFQVTDFFYDRARDRCVLTGRLPSHTGHWEATLYWDTTDRTNARSVINRTGFCRVNLPGHLLMRA